MENTGWHLADLDPEGPLAIPYHEVDGEWVSLGQYGYPDSPDGALRTNVPALAKFFAMMAGGGGDILSQASVDEIATPQMPDIDETQGLIWYYTGRSGARYLGHNGGDSDVSTEAFIRMDDGVGFIVLMNGSWRTADAVTGMEIARMEYAAEER